MLFLFHLEQTIGYMEKENKDFLNRGTSAMYYLLGLLENKLVSNFAIPCEVSKYTALELPFYWSTTHEFLLNRDINTIHTLLRDIAINNCAIRIMVVDWLVFGIEVT